MRWDELVFGLIYGVFWLWSVVSIQAMNDTPFQWDCGSDDENPLRAFTLTELLLVIAIIAVLVALLLPALGRARNQSAKAVDFNNLRQVMVSIHVYADNNKDSLTWPNWDYGHALPDGTVRPGWLYTMDLSTSGPAAFKEQTGQLWDLLHEPKVFLCPMDRQDEIYISKGKTKERAQQLSTYVMNGAVIGFRSGYHSNAIPVKISQMRPGDCILFEADDRDAFCYNDGASWPSEGISTRHLHGATQAALDGSSDYVRDDAWAADVSCTNKNRLWCYPKTADGGDPIYGHDN
jgi:prepilin-type N-terminal cleavage/methylation domain-containing protein